MSDQRGTLLSRRKIRDRSMVLVLAGVALFMPPLVGMSEIDGKIGGVPVPLVYIFGVWGALIVVAMLLSRRLDDREAPLASSETSDTDS